MCCTDGSVGGCDGLTATNPTLSPSLAPGDGGCSCDAIERMSCNTYGGAWSEYTCTCASPVLLDVAGDGFQLTTGAGGVSFDIDGDGTPEHLAWTEQGSDDAWLFLDRNGNGAVDSGRELFGNSTPQPAPPAGAERNGFLALSVYDLKGNGGNGDGVIDNRDTIFSSLRLWQDTNHNGVSEAGELYALPAKDVVRVHLTYKESKRTDAQGNRFRYRAKIDDDKGAKVGRWAWDVFLARAL
jgi:hypothetical protein